MPIEAEDSAAPWALPGMVGEGVSKCGLSSLASAQVVVPEDVTTALADLGLHLTPRKTADSAVLAKAEHLIRIVPGLWSVMSHRIERLATLRCDDVCYDISHSDPQWPGLVLVSMPPPTAVGYLRLAESVIHEAMHHHLSAYEAKISLMDSDEGIHSPWKGTVRPSSGVLHGIFVFTCIAYALKRLLGADELDRSQAAHVRDRISQIGIEFATIDRAALIGRLTQAGTSLVSNLDVFG
jgi:HEXXH motif-containing protein